MNNPLELMTALQTQLPGFEFILDAAETATGSSWINISGQPIVIEHKPGLGFGLFLSDDGSYGNRPDEIYRDAALLLKRLGQLLSEPFATANISSTFGDDHFSVARPEAISGPLAHATRKQITLKDIREILGITQADVAKALGKQQSAISKIEKRDDVLISTLVSLIHGMNGVVEITAKFEGCDVSIYSDEEVPGRAITLET